MTEVSFDGNTAVFGNNAPIFSGKSEDFERFPKMVRYWKSQSPLKPEKLAGKLILCQTDPHVLDIIMDLDEAEVESSNGLQTVMAALAEKYKIDSDDMASPAFDEFDAISRGMNETGAQFVLRFEIAYAKVRSYDKEFMMSDRSLAMLCLRRMNISQEHRALLIGNIKAPTTTRKIFVKAIKTVFKSDVPQETVPKVKKEKKEEDIATEEKGEAFMAPESDLIDDSMDDNAYFVRKGNKFVPVRNNNNYNSSSKNDNAMICERCGKSGHEAANCTLNWQQARDSLKKITLSGGPFPRDTSYMFMPMNADDDDETVNGGFDNAGMYFGEIVPEFLDSDYTDALE